MRAGSRSTAPDESRPYGLRGPSRPELALQTVEELLAGGRHPPRLAWQHVLASALRSLEQALRARVAELDDRAVVEEPRRGITRRLHLARRTLDDLAGRTEALAAVVAASVERQPVEEAVQEHVAHVRTALDEESEALLDAYWVDLGVGD